MNQVQLLNGGETLYLTQLELFNWGGFSGPHCAPIDHGGTAVIGPTGSGKTTLVDALMTLLCANPRYNLASTGGHESDRDLVSYVRGVSGPGDGGDNQTHIARPGKTVTAVAASFGNGERVVRLGMVLWFDGTSSSASDMKKLWLFADVPEHTLEHWLTVHHEGGMRALRQMEKDGTGIWTYPSKKGYLARLRDYFEVSENAFTLLNRAAGLKQLNSIDEVFRELVLDDRSAFARAEEVAASFDDLAEIHEELEIARRQQRALQPVADGWEDYLRREQALAKREVLKQILPVWYAEQAHRLWQAREQELKTLLQHNSAEEARLEEQLASQRLIVEARRQAYLNAGGASVEHLEARISEWRKMRDQRAKNVKDYCQLTQSLAMPDTIDGKSLHVNQEDAQSRKVVLSDEIKAAESNAFKAGVSEREANDCLVGLQRERNEVMARPGSNIPPAFQDFRTALAQELSQSEEVLPFVAELVQVKESEHRWRGAIERAIGSHRLRILVAPEQIRAALRWVNQRHNRLHVRLLEVEVSDIQPRFFEDGFTRKLEFKHHPFRETIKSLLAGIDRHCVSDPDQLRGMKHAMTPEGLMSGKAHHFDKQDQKRLDQDWMTGFDNRDRLATLEQAIEEAGHQLREKQAELEVAKNQSATLGMQMAALESLIAIDFEQIDLPGANRMLTNLQQQLDALNDPDSDMATIRRSLDEAESQAKKLEGERHQAMEKRIEAGRDFKHAKAERERAFRRAETGLSDEQRQIAAAHLPEFSTEERDEIQDLERRASTDLQSDIDTHREKLSDAARHLVQKMADAKSVDRGALSEVGRELEDIPAYLERLRVLTEEALPEKLKRFLEYLNLSSDEGVTQLLSHIDNEVSMIEERIEDLNHTLRRVDFQPERYLKLISKKVVHESLRSLQRAQRHLNSARFSDDNGESHYKALQYLVSLLCDACERHRTQGARALLDPRYRLEFAVSVIDRQTGSVIETRTGSQGGSGGEKEIIASYVLTASLSYALCPDGSSRPLFGTIVLDEAFSRSSHAVAGRIIAALREFGLHAVFITPNKEMRLLRNHTRSAVVVHRRGTEATLIPMSWEALDEKHRQRIEQRHEVTG